MKIASFLNIFLLPMVLLAQEPYFVLNDPEGHYSTIGSLMLTDDNKTAITIGMNESICFWDIESASLKKKLWLDVGRGSKFIDAAIDNKLGLIAIARFNSKGDPVVNFLDFKQEKIVGTFSGFTEYLGFVRFDPNSKFVLTGTTKICQENEGIKLWKIPDFNDPTEVIDIPDAELDFYEVGDLAFYENGKKLLLTPSCNVKWPIYGLEINHNSSSIPEYELKLFNPKIRPYRATPNWSFIRYLDNRNQFVFAKAQTLGTIDIDGKFSELAISYPFDEPPFFENLFVDPISEISYCLTSEYGGLILDLKQNSIVKLTENFSQVVFNSPASILGIKGSLLMSVNHKDGSERIFTKLDYLSDDPIGFASNKTIIFDSTRKSFDFENLQFEEPARQAREVSIAKNQYKNLEVEIRDSWPGDFAINDKLQHIHPRWTPFEKFTFLNDGQIVLALFGDNTDFRNLMFNIEHFKNKPSHYFPLKEFIGNHDFISGIAPSPHLTSSLFVIRDQFGLTSIYDSKGDITELIFDSNIFEEHEFHSAGVKFGKNPSISGYTDSLKDGDVFIGINGQKIKDLRSLNRYIENLNPSQPILVDIIRNEKQISVESNLSSIKTINPLLSFINKGSEWLCWNPQGYYAASAGGEKFGGWVVNKNGVNNVAEFHPIYDFKKKYYNPNLIKLIAKEESFEKAVSVYNESALVPIGDNNMNVAQNLPPSISWTNPRSRDTTFNQNLVKLTAQIVSDSEVRNVKILMNGRTVLRRDQVSIRENESGTYTVNFEIDLVAKSNTINLFVENENGSTISEERIINAKQILKGIERYKPNLYMVSIGVSNHSINNYSLDYADDDALAMSDLYVSQKGQLFKDVFQRTLVNEKATRENILNAFYWLENNATQKDVVVIFIASHGINERDKFYILPFDGDPEKIRITGVDWVNFSDILGNLPSKVMMFLDACHSGKLGSNLLASRGETDLLEAVRALATEENGVVIMAASTGKEYSFESSEWGHGAFTLALLEGMKEGKADLNGDGIVNIREIDYYVAERVKELTGGKQHPTTQKPSVVAEFPLVQVNN